MGWRTWCAWVGKLAVGGFDEFFRAATATAGRLEGFDPHGYQRRLVYALPQRSLLVEQVAGEELGCPADCPDPKRNPRSTLTGTMRSDHETLSDRSTSSAPQSLPSAASASRMSHAEADDYSACCPLRRNRAN